ncbi:MAG: alpha/beta fold hydrolase [Deltaproteobacteria bacterium]|nr:alpha/beta fold hydrolase [Deltaproteobacteria bacterium]
MPTRIFVHGLDSSNQGTKATFFREHYPDMILPNFPGSLEERMRILRDVLEGKSDIVLVGSSFGGLMATLFTLENEERVKRLILLAPALNLVGSEAYGGREISIPTWIYQFPLRPLKTLAANSSRTSPLLNWMTTIISTPPSETFRGTSYFHEKYVSAQ